MFWKSIFQEKKIKSEPWKIKIILTIKKSTKGLNDKIEEIFKKQKKKRDKWKMWK